MENYKYFCNKSCEYFPCHNGISKDNFNCLFCYCPMNPYEDCLGAPQYIETSEGKRIKDCSACVFPHIPENYDAVIQFLTDKNNKAN